VPIKKKHIGMMEILGLPTEEEEDSITEEDLQDQQAAYEDTDPSQIEYNPDTGEVSGIGSSTGNGEDLSNQMEAMRYFNMLKPDRNSGKWKAHDKLYVSLNEMGTYYRFEEQGGMMPFHIPEPQGILPSGAVSIIRQSTSESQS